MIKVLFLHRGFPGQLKFFTAALASLPEFDVKFISSNMHSREIKGVDRYTYTIPNELKSKCSDNLKVYYEAVLHGKESAKIARNLKKEGWIPDIIIAHSWGNSMYIKDIFPQTPLLCYFEWYRNANNFDGTPPSEEKRMQVRCDNAYLLPDLCAADAGLSPTEWQRIQFPKEFQHKIQVIHDGVDTESCRPNLNAKFFVKDENITFTAKDKVITYATRGMEPYRGFPQFMEMAEKVLKTHPDTHFVIAGLDKVFYGEKHGSYKQEMITKLNLDMSRVHFVGELEFADYISLLQISSVHVYLTYPFVLSWSIIEALSTGCLIVSSKTPPVEEVIKDNENGLLVDFFNVEELTEKVIFALENQSELKNIRENARKTAVEKYEAKLMLNKLYNYMMSIIKNKEALK